MVKNSLQCRRCRFDPWVGKIPLRRAWPTPVFLPGESHRQRSMEGYSPWGCKESDTTEWLSIYDISPSLPDLLHSVWQSLSPSTNIFFFFWVRRAWPQFFLPNVKEGDVWKAGDGCLGFAIDLHLHTWRDMATTWCGRMTLPPQQVRERNLPCHRTTSPLIPQLRLTLLWGGVTTILS